MSRRTTIYIPDHARPVIGPLGSDDSLSGRITTILQRYQEILDRSRPQFAEAEWLAIIDANLAHWFGDDPSELRLIWLNVADAEGLGKKWGIDQAALANKLRQLPYAAQVAVTEIIERYHGSGGASHRDRLEAAGIKCHYRNEK